MKSILSQLIADFQERELPELVARDNVFSEIPGKADVAIGMRRTGKTFFCYQKITELLAPPLNQTNPFMLKKEDPHDARLFMRWGRQKLARVDVKLEGVGWGSVG